MTTEEFSNNFDVLYNNVTSNQAPGLNEFEKSVFLTKAQDEVVKNHWSARSKGNSLQQGYDDSAKRQTDFSNVMRTASCRRGAGQVKINPHSVLYHFPDDVFIAVNETITTTKSKLLQVIPLRYDEYTRLMSKPFQRPLKNQAWRLINSGDGTDKLVEIVTNAGDSVNAYRVRYIKTLRPIVLTDLGEDAVSVNGVTEVTECELDSSLHEEILQRAVEIAKAAWVASGSNENLQVVTQMGQRGE